MKLKKAQGKLKEMPKNSAIIRILGRRRKVKIVTGRTNVIRFLELAPSRVLQVK